MQNSLTRRGTTTGFQSAGDEVRADAGSPKAPSAMGGAQFRPPFTPPEPLGGAAQNDDRQQDRPELPEEPPTAEGGGWQYKATVEAPGPAYGGAAYNGGGG